jgi:hippurate hydrolase
LALSICQFLAENKSLWSGTALFLFQSSEEGGTTQLGSGAQCMIRNGLFAKFPVPVDGLLAVHVAPDLAAGKVRVRSGIAFAHATLFEIKVKGIAGHGGAPYKGAIDSILLACRIVCALQSIVSRELSPLEEQAIISIGAIRGGDAANALPGEVVLKGTTRCLSEVVFEKLKTAIRRVCNGEAAAAGLEPARFPEVNFDPTYAPQLYNDPALGAHLMAVYTSILGEPAVEIPAQPVTFGEDFANYHLLSPDKKVPIFLTWLGAVDPSKFDSEGKPLGFLPPLHNGDFTPYWNENAGIDTFRAGVLTQTCALLSLFEGE